MHQSRALLLLRGLEGWGSQRLRWVKGGSNAVSGQSCHWVAIEASLEFRAGWEQNLGKWNLADVRSRGHQVVLIGSG